MNPMSGLPLAVTTPGAFPHNANWVGTAEDVSPQEAQMVSEETSLDKGVRKVVKHPSVIGYL